MRGRWAAIVAVALVTSVGLAGCVGIPRSGSVEAGALIDEETLPDFAYQPLGPQVGATQQEILQGFIAAATNPQDDYAVARLFLADAIKDEWNPNALTQIRSGIGAAKQQSDTRFSYSLTSSAHVNDRGQYVEDETTTQQLEFDFEPDAEGEWRISTAPDGIVLSQESFDTIFEARALYYFDPSYRYLIPDVRWFPTTTLLATRVVSALLAGQSSWLQQGVTISEFPTGTTLGSRVTVDSGVATVELSDEVLTASPASRERMRQQLRDTIGNVATVVITVNGVEIDIPDSGLSQAEIDPDVESQLLLRNAETFGYLASDGSVSPLAGQVGDIIDLAATDVALSRDGSMSAVLGTGGVSVVFTGSAKPLSLDTRAGLVAPSVDPFGFIWTVPSSDAAALRAYDAEGQSYPVDASAFAGMRAVSLSLSRDGSRLLLLASTNFGTRLFVAGVVRSEGLPARVGELFALPIDSATPLDAAWIDDRTVASLTRSGDNALVTLFQLGGPSESLGGIAGGSSIVGGNGGADGLRVLTSTGDVYRPRGNSWADTGTSGISFLATQQ